MPQRRATHTHAAPPTAGHRGAPALPQPLPFGTWPGGSEPALQALGRFRDLMASQGQSVQVARMCFDRLYAFERIAAAHATNHGPLRELALHLFQACHYGDPARHHD
ncbi:MAG: hypothetical protein IV094_16840 [Vitreoscilla sp.]|nr:hypothetical protein [Vitreoscilla sp.]